MVIITASQLSGSAPVTLLIQDLLSQCTVEINGVEVTSTLSVLNHNSTVTFTLPSTSVAPVNVDVITTSVVYNFVLSLPPVESFTSNAYSPQY